MSEKYTCMMKRTSPREYVRIENLLLILEREVFALIDKIIEIGLKWQ